MDRIPVLAGEKAERARKKGQFPLAALLQQFGCKNAGFRGKI
jgi:hypothetical protein